MASKHSRPFMPGYGIAAETEGAGLLPWSFVEERMATAHNYWVSTAGPRGRMQRLFGDYGSKAPFISALVRDLAKDATWELTRRSAHTWKAGMRW
ncbi:MAG: hypothetical protein WD740_07085 [Anaerolineales bacterium]